MNIDQLKEGQELLELIKSTEDALENAKSLTPQERDPQRIHDDKLYNLYVSKFGDGSGININLCRYYGNERILKGIIKELELQLNEFKIAFDKL